MAGSSQPSDGRFQDLPLDSDTDVGSQPAAAPRPDAIRRTDAGVVFVGGAAGAAVRAAMAAPATGNVSGPVVMMAINVAGCLLLGVLLELLARRGPDHGRRRITRLLVGTGMLGGFTSYSTFTVQIFDMLRSGHVVGGLGYGLGSLLAGVLAAAVGVWIGTWIHRRGGADRHG